MLGNTSQSLSQEGHRTSHNDISGRDTGREIEHKEKNMGRESSAHMSQGQWKSEPDTHPFGNIQ